MDWIYRTLERIVGPEKRDTIADRMISMKAEKDYDDYVKTVLDLRNPQHLQFNNAVRKQLFGENLRKKKDDKNGSQSTKKNKKQQNQKDNGEKINKGRVRCGCEGRLHGFVCNCLKCGLFLCTLEGPGPCFFCDTMVERESPNAAEAKKKKNATYSEAIELRDRLIQCDKSAELRHVKDDQHCFFDMTSPWLTREERTSLQANFKKMVEMCDKSKQEMLFSYDLNLRQFVRETPKMFQCELEYDRNECKLDPEIRRLAILADKQYYEDMIKALNKKNKDDKSSQLLTDDDISNHEEYKDANFIAEIAEVYDQNVVLSIRQPWASLVIHGFKPHDGRNNSLNLRGPVWVLALPSKLSKKDIEREEKYYLENADFDTTNMQLPTEYPTNVILGQINVTDCLSFEEYKEKYPFGLEENNFVFIFESPKILNKPLRIKGIQDICKLKFN